MRAYASRTKKHRAPLADVIAALVPIWAASDTEGFNGLRLQFRRLVQTGSQIGHVSRCAAWIARYVMPIDGGGLLRNFSGVLQISRTAQAPKWRRPPRRCDGAASGLHPCPVAPIPGHRPGEVRMPCRNSS